MKTCIKALMLGAAWMAFAAPAMAQSSGVYVGAALGSANGKSKVYDYGRHPSFALTVGYRFSDSLAIEAVARSLEFSFLEGFLATQSHDYPHSHQGVALRLSQPLNPQFSAYGRLGVGNTRYNVVNVKAPQGRRSQAEGSAGLGLAYDFNPSFGLKLEYNRFLRSDVNTLSLGGEYRF